MYTHTQTHTLPDAKTVKSHIEIWRTDIYTSKNSDREKWPAATPPYTTGVTLLTAKSHIEIWSDIHPYIQELGTDRGDIHTYTGVTSLIPPPLRRHHTYIHTYTTIHLPQI